MEKEYSFLGLQTALDELSNILAYPSDVKETIYLDSFNRLSFASTFTAKKISNGYLNEFVKDIIYFSNDTVCHANMNKKNIKTNSSNQTVN